MSKTMDTGLCTSITLAPSCVARRTSVAGAAEPSREGEAFSFIAAVTPPFRLDLTAWALRRRSINQTDRWDGSVYARTIHVDQIPVELFVESVGSINSPRLRVRVTGVCRRALVETAVRQALNHVLGLSVDLTGFYATAAAEPPLDELANRFRGMRPPRFPSIFEALMNGIACQQLSLQAGLTLLNRLVDTFGRFSGPPEAGRGKAFPQPQALAGVDTRSLQALGFSQAKSIAIREIAIAAAKRELEYETIANFDDAAACTRLQELRGVGRWTAEYVLLRGCGRLNIFPGDDVGARNNLQKWLRRKRSLDYDSTKRLLRRWQPYAGLVYLHLLLKRIDDQTMISRVHEI
jgi:DNA-3-methyladenine glycosylase II